MNLKMIQQILEKVQNKKLIVKNTSSSDCNFLEPTINKDSSFIICKSYSEKEDEDYQWKIIELDEWGMLNLDTEMYYKKEKEEYNLLEKIHSEVCKK